MVSGYHLVSPQRVGHDVATNIFTSLFSVYKGPSIWHLCACFGRSAVFHSCDPVDCSPPSSSVHGDSPAKNTGVGCPALLQEIFATQGSNPSLPHCRWVLYRLSHQGSPWCVLILFPFPFLRSKGLNSGNGIVSSPSCKHCPCTGNADFLLSRPHKSQPSQTRSDHVPFYQLEKK